MEEDSPPRASIWGKYIMGDKAYSLDCGGITLRYDFLYPETSRFFGKYLSECVDMTLSGNIHVTTEFMEENRWLVDDSETSQAYLEFQALMLATGNSLLSYNRALFHGVALLWRQHGWIITAPSGTGKTTQYRHWRNLLKQNVRMINGDKPILGSRKDGSVWVYSSPWRGKERFGRPGQCAPLGGIILLERGHQNQIKRLAPEEAVQPLFLEFVSCPETTEQILHQAQFLQHMLDVLPVWKLVNRGDEDSALLTLKTLGNYLEEQS